MNHQTIQTDNIELYTESFGKPSNPGVLLISGAMAPARFWTDDFCRQLADAGYFIIRYDHRDIGLSSAVNYAAHPYTLNSLAQDAVAVLDGYTIKKVHLVGHSMGGAIAQLVALDFPDRVLSIAVISSSVLTMPQVHNDEKQRLEKTWRDLDGLNKPTRTFEDSVDGFLRSYKYLHGTIPMDAVIAREYIRDMYARSRSEHIAWFERFSSGVEPFHNHVKAQLNIIDRTQDLKQVHVPVLALHGEQDCLTFARLIHTYLIDLVPHARMVMIPGMGHMILSKKLFERIGRELVEFWAMV